MFANISLFPPSVSSYFSQSKAPSSSFESLRDLNDLGRFLTSGNHDFDQWMTWKNEIKAFIARHSENCEELDAFFSSITDWGMERNPKRMLAILVEIVSLDILTRVVSLKQQNSDQPFTNIFDLADKHAADCPKPVDASLKTQLSLEWKRSRPFILYFIPNLINLFLGAFNFLDSQKKYTTLWDKHLLVEIAWKFCIIPNLLVKALQPIFGVTVKVYVIAAVIIAGIGVLISSYHRWFKPLPDEIVNCVNLDKQIERGIIDPKVGQTKEMRQLIAALSVDANVILIGLAGEGKTALIHQFIQDKQKGKIPELQSLRVYGVDCGLMISNVSYGHAELINQTREQIDGFEKQVLFFFDEFFQIVSKEDAFRAFKKKFLEDKPNCKCIIAVTPTEWEKLKILDEDYSFRRRMRRIKVQSTDQEQIRKIIKNLEYCFAPNVPVTEDAIERIIEICGQKDYLPKIGRAAKAEDIFKRAVSSCRSTYCHRYSEEIRKDQLKMIREQVQTIKRIIAHQQKIKIDQALLSHRLAQANTFEDHFEDPDIDMDKLEKVDILRADSSAERAKVMRLPSKESFSEKEQIMYLWYSFYAMKSIERILNREIEKIDPKIALQVNRQLVDRAYQEIRSTEETESKEEKKNNE